MDAQGDLVYLNDDEVSENGIYARLYSRLTAGKICASCVCIPAFASSFVHANAPRRHIHRRG
jgi:hypothetical protein